MFMIFSKEKILSYLVSLSTVALLFVLSFAITKKNDEILKTSANLVSNTVTVESVETSEEVLNPNAKDNNETENITNNLQK